MEKVMTMLWDLMMQYDLPKWPGSRFIGAIWYFPYQQFGPTTTIDLGFSHQIGEMFASAYQLDLLAIVVLIYFINH